MSIGTGEAIAAGRPAHFLLIRQPILLAFLLVSFLAFVSAKESAPTSPGRQVFSEPHMGTLMHITLFAEDEKLGIAAARAAFDRIQDLNSILSDYDQESELMRLTRRPAGTAVKVSDDLFEVLTRGQIFSEKTNGAFDVTLGPLSQLWRNARRSGTLPEQTALEKAKGLIGYRNLHLNPAEKTVTLAVPGMKLDLGGIAKGYAADEALKVLRVHGISRALVAAAGDLAFGDPPPDTNGWRIGIDSIDTGGTGMTREISLKNHAVSTSGDTEQFVEIDGVRYSHIVDPQTGIGLTERIGVTVLAPDATTADSLSTAISVMGAKKGLALVESLQGVEALIVVKTDSGKTILSSSGFPREQGTAPVMAEPIEISGRYPHLAMFSDSQEIGLGAAVYWQGRLWVVTYSPHKPGGSSDKLYMIDDDLNMETFAGSVGGTPANRLIHRESNQLLIGPYVIDSDRNIRVIPTGKRPQDADINQIYGRLTATARHLTDPANKVYHFDMEGVLYEVDVHTLDVNLLHVRPVPGWHGKGGYTGQGRLVLANNGERGAANQSVYGEFEYRIGPTRASDEDAGALAEWDGADDWNLLKRRQFTEVTGPGGIYGAPDDEAPVWATGWDKRSLILMVMQEGEWHEFRLPKADHSYDGYHGWHTEWPRIREAVPAAGGEEARLLMNKHGGFFNFPKGLTAEDTSGLYPLGNYLKIISDTQPWHDGRIVFAANETSTFHNPAAGQAQSNLWFSSWDGIQELGQPAGWGGLWMEDDIQANTASVPFLIGDYTNRVLHLAHQTDSSITFNLEIDSTGRGDWKPYKKIDVPAHGYGFHVLKDGLNAQWIRVRANRDATKATAYFHLGVSRGVIEDPELFAPLANVGDDSPYIHGIIRPRGGDRGTLHMLATRVEKDGATVNLGHYEIGPDLILQNRSSDTDAAAKIANVAAIDETGTRIAPERDVTVSHDAASVIVTQGERVFRLPKSHEAYDEIWPAGHRRGVREVVTERAILNAHGTFYMIPRNNSGGVRAIKPISTHDKRIIDWCSWRGMLAIMGTAANADASHPNYVASEDGKTGLWLGDIDDLWKLGKPRGVGGPWRDTAVRAGEHSDPYLMTGYDKKRLLLSHRSNHPVTFSIQIELFGAIDTPETYFLYKEITVEPGKTVEHRFPDGFAAHWARVVCDTDTTASAIFVYE